MSDSLRLHEPQHARPPCPSQTPRVHPNPCPLSRWCHPTISSSVIPFSSRLQSLPASGLFQWVSSSHQVAKVLAFQLHASCSMLESGAPHRGNTSGHDGKGMLGDQCWGAQSGGVPCCEGDTWAVGREHMPPDTPRAGGGQGRPWSRSLSGLPGVQWAAWLQWWAGGDGRAEGAPRHLVGCCGPVSPGFGLHCTLPT